MYPISKWVAYEFATADLNANQMRHVREHKDSIFQQEDIAKAVADALATAPVSAPQMDIF